MLSTIQLQGIPQICSNTQTSCVRGTSYGRNKELSEMASTIQQMLTQGGIRVTPAAAVMRENADEQWMSQGLPSLALG